jgi:LuxR family transcriptional regulator, maltose regulon positive regulatory protein
MSTPILATKLYIPLLGPKVVLRTRLIERLNEGLQRKLTLISATTGFGKTTLVSEWVAGCKRQAAWLSLDEGDNDPKRLLTYLVAALQTIQVKTGEGILGLLHSPQTPPVESILTALLNEISAIDEHFILVLDDYHVIEAKPVDDALAFLLEHLPPQVHLVIATREDPNLPLARLRARGQLTELRANDLRFTPCEAAGFLNQVMGLNLSAEDIALLSTRTEGWIAGLQLAALALQGTISTQGHQDAASFIKSFTGSHHFVMDYLIEEVLQQQPESIQTFLLRTSILDRLCGPLCDAVCSAGTTLDPLVSGQEALKYLERANLFLVPLDNERRWYRYHHLFADLLRQRLYQSITSLPGDEKKGVAEYHVRASVWYENNGLEIEAFHHAAAANDIDRAERLMEGGGMPLPFRGVVTPVLHWLESLPKALLDARPSLWVMYASALSMICPPTGVEEKLQAAESTLQGLELDEMTRNLIGHIAAIRAFLAVSQNQVEVIIAQSRRALEFLHPDNLAFRAATIWELGIAYQLQGDRAAAGRAYTEAISISQASGNIIITLYALNGLGNVQESENQLYLAAAAYQRVLRLGDEPQQPAEYEAHFGLARIFYQWNDLDAAEQHGQQSVQLARHMDDTDRCIVTEVFLARLKLARKDVAGAAAILAQTEQLARQHNSMNRSLEIASAQVLILLHQGNPAAAAILAEKKELPLDLARVHLAQGDTSAALALLVPYGQQMEAKGWQDERLRALILQTLAYYAQDKKEIAVQLLGEALALAEPGGFIRIFVDEGAPMARLLSQTAAQGIMPDYIGKLLAAFEAEKPQSEDESYLFPAQPIVVFLSQRELEIIQLIAQGLSNQEISERLFLALDTVKGHNRRIYGKLQVQRRTEAIARARQLDLL